MHLQRSKVNSLIKPCGSQGSKLGPSSDLGQKPLPIEPSLQHKIQFYFWKPTSHLTGGKHYSRRVSDRFTHRSYRACSAYFTRITVDMCPLSVPLVLFR